MLFVYIAALLGILYWLFMSPFSQIFGFFPFRGKTTKKVVALTFDDGPNEPYTLELLAFLKQEDVRATFFMVGKMVERYPATAKKIYASGHAIGNHTVSHNFLNYFKSLSLKQEIENNQKIIKKHVGKTPGLYRAPWLFRQPWILQTLKQNKIVPVSGEFCHSFEVLRVSPERIARGAIAKARPGAIIIFHDGIEGRGGDRKNTIEAVKLTVHALKKQGYHFVTVNDLLGVPAYQD